MIVQNCSPEEVVRLLVPKLAQALSSDGDDGGMMIDVDEASHHPVWHVLDAPTWKHYVSKWLPSLFSATPKDAHKHLTVLGEVVGHHCEGPGRTDVVSFLLGTYVKVVMDQRKPDVNRSLALLLGAPLALAASCGGACVGRSELFDFCSGVP